MATQNKIRTDFTLAYLRWRVGLRSSPPNPRQYGLTAVQAREKVLQVDACLNRHS